VTGWETVIGLEIHVQLKTQTKMFCRCANGFGGAENTQTCPVCLAHPGALPVPNRVAIEWAIKLGLALGCDIAPRAIFARKNYFYPDLPKGYQISQYEEPLCLNGHFAVPEDGGEREIGIVRAHLEEDAAKTVHVGGGTGRKVGAEHSLVDFNRGGTPLVEIVTQPDLRSAEEVRRFLQLLRQTIVELGISDAEMEKGSMRVDTNVSVRRPGEGYRTRTELKNINSFRFIAQGIDAEIARQIALYEAGGELVQETLDFDAATGTLTPHRSKEEADDYRYFPEPDLVPVEPPAELLERLRSDLPELPAARIRRLEEHVGLHVAEELVSTGNDAAARLLAGAGLDWRTAANLATNEYGGRVVPAESAAEIAKLVERRSEITREAFAAAIAASLEPGFLAQEYLTATAISDADELMPIVEAILAANPGEVEAYRGGKDGLLGFFVGQVMKKTGGKANPKAVNELLREKLKV
jgi:aspartyl-tRNA(Asn)/glutamyl-tRNA(Gln) amidotransferase subunit B